MVELGPLNRVLARVRRRLRWQHVLEGTAIGAGAGLLVLAAGLVSARLEAPWLQAAAWLAGALLAAGAALGALFPVPVARAAFRIDLSHGLKSRFQSALEFSQVAAPGPFMAAAIRDAVQRAPALSPQQAAPLHRPRALPYTGGALVVLALAAVVPLPSDATEQTPQEAGARPVAHLQVDGETLEAFRQDLRRLAREPGTPKEDVARYGEVLDALERGELTRDEALAALSALQRGLVRQGATYTRVVKQGLARIATGLGSGRVTAELVEALEGGDAQAAAEALEELARRLAEGKLTPREREALHDALERAAAKQAEAEPSEPDLLDRKQPEPPESEPSLLKDPEERERQLEELRREREARDRAERQLEQLRRELEQAGSQGAQAGGSQNMDQAAQRLREMGQDGMSAEQRRKLAEQIEQLREQLQRQGAGGQQQQQPGSQQGGGQGGESQAQRMQRFRLQAGGGEGEGGQQQPMQVVAPPKPGEGRDGGAGDAGGSTPGDGGADAGDDTPKTQVLQLGGEGEANATLEMPGLGGQEQRREQRGGGGSDSPPEPRPDTDLSDSQLGGVAVKGPSRSEVILGAADQGFASAPYERVYGEYRSHAESVLERDEIPPGYRFYVRRYFQLIRPREGSQNE